MKSLCHMAHLTHPSGLDEPEGRANLKGHNITLYRRKMYVDTARFCTCNIYQQ